MILNALRIAITYGIEVEKIEEFMEKYPHRIYNQDGVLAMYAKITDETLEKLKERKINIKDKDQINKLMEENGDNTHFLFLTGEGVGNIKRVAQKLTDKTISWFKPDLSKLIIFGGVKCQQQYQ